RGPRERAWRLRALGLLPRPQRHHARVRLPDPQARPARGRAARAQARQADGGRLMPRLRQVPRAEVTSETILNSYNLLFGDRDPAPGPGWWAPAPPPAPAALGGRCGPPPRTCSAMR